MSTWTLRPRSGQNARGPVRVQNVIPIRVSPVGIFVQNGDVIVLVQNEAAIGFAHLLKAFELIVERVTIHLRTCGIYTHSPPTAYRLNIRTCDSRSDRPPFPQHPFSACHDSCFTFSTSGIRPKLPTRSLPRKSVGRWRLFWRFSYFHPIVIPHEFHPRRIVQLLFPFPVEVHRHVAAERIVRVDAMEAGMIERN
jgi:hypothetical protein